MVDYAELIIIPTALERDLAGTKLAELSVQMNARVELCGWGLVQSAVRTAEFLIRHQPKRVWLIGIAGALSAELHVGSAYEFSRVACYGIGVGSGQQWTSFDQLGWSSAFGGPECPAIELALSTAVNSERLLLSVCSASADQSETLQKCQAFARAEAEDMESYSVAVACQLQEIPLRIIRGISNQAGDRRLDQWKTQAAIQAAVELLRATV